MPRHDNLLRLSLAVLLLTPALLPRQAFALPGQVLDEQKISDTAGAFTGVLDDSDRFGVSAASLGDLDNDGVADVAVGARADDDGGTDRGAVWILFLNADGTVKAHQKISDTDGNFTGTLTNADNFGQSVASIGDLDGDDVTDIAVGAHLDNDGGTDRGAVWILFLNDDGTVKSHSKISDTSGGFGGTLTNADNFGFSVASLGDLDGDSVPELAVGAPFDDDGGSGRGAVWVLFMQTDGTVDSEVKISDSTPGISGSLANDDGFGAAVAGLNDLDNDGVKDLAVGAVGDDDGNTDAGAVYVIFLTASASIDSVQKISETAGGFTGALDSSDMFGNSIVEVRDLDNDGINELIVGAPNDDDGGINRGAVWVLFMNTDGTVALHRKISSALGGLVGPLDDGDMFGMAATTPRDLDGDGVADLIVGAWQDDDGGTNRGAVYALFLDGVPGAFCGDGILDPGEDCDDSNNDPGDCCSAACEFDAAATPCPNGDVCDGDETCDGAGNCDPGTPLTCEDGDLCTQDLCDPDDGCIATSGPATVCFDPGKAKIDIIDKPDDSKDKVNWKFTKGEEVQLAELGTPNATTDYALCVYDGESGSPVFSFSLEVPPSNKWTPGNNSWKYKDKLATEHGVFQMLVKAGANGKSKAQLKAKGFNVPMPTPIGPSMFYEQNPSVIVQLLNSEGSCWTSSFTPPATKNLDERFKDKLP